MGIRIYHLLMKTVSSESCWLTAASESGSAKSVAASSVAASRVPIDENWTKYDQNLSMQPTRKRPAQAEQTHGHDQHLCTEASVTGLEHARKSVLRTPSLEIRQRRARLLGHLLTLASDGCPVSVRTLYKSYRSSVRATVEEIVSHKLKIVLQNICNGAPGVEFFI
jgi:hypothetical protein